jgi:hypothetical protein
MLDMVYLVEAAHFDGDGYGIQCDFGVNLRWALLGTLVMP